MSKTQEIRRTNLAKVRRDQFSGNAADLARAIGKSPSQVGQWLSGHRSISEGSARHIERRLNLSQLELDLPSESQKNTRKKRRTDPLAIQVSDSSPQLRRFLEVLIEAEGAATVPPRWFEAQARALQVLIDSTPPTIFKHSEQALPQP